MVSNRAERDISIAKRKASALYDVTSAVAKVRSLGNPLVQAGVR